MHKQFVMMSGWQRLLCAAIVGILAGLGLSLTGLAPAPCGLLGWCTGAAVYLVPAWWLAETSDADRTRSRAQSMDPPRAWLLVVMLVAVSVSMAVILTLLRKVPTLHGMERIGLITLGLAALASSWLMIHTIYAFHYAHRYYQAEIDPGEHGPGLDFPGKLDPDYFDFLYYSFVVGMTSQVSDVQVTSRDMRRITLVHGVVSFAFNMLVLALSINVVATLIQNSANEDSVSSTAAATQLDKPGR
ncbi:DUF1345 domain-containing protein [Variovorax sp. J22P240]|uniref:DUF1345 domain-containing protein n=1 Tax=unclassified Variovorax TaxID=663243 RepID=UPI002578B9F1|nr:MULTISPECIES: DUF1345 domain-containing protein [unclassified Variovorax]MDM0002022.1 DUF1345 domain-containing protein [Variovorax sp. J22P240]MDM0052305.1 DUF1345 domain-containing protein [Variovorax sp. J22R115]